MRRGERLPTPLNDLLRDRAREMRRKMTPAEAKHWSRIRGDQLGGLRFRRQHPIGPFITDFFCPGKRLVVEVDGDTHFEPGAEQADNDRTSYFAELGLRELRFTNVDVLTNVDGVVAEIMRFVGLE
jgi:very-short-patch-repair endonuclease